MKKIFFVLSFPLILIACKNTSENKPGANDSQKADSLYEEVMDGHNEGMAKMSKIETARQEANRLLDSIAKLPAKARAAAQPYKAKLDTLISQLNTADIAMDKWMKEMNWDSASNNIEKRINYLTEENQKVTRVKESILNSLQNADSVLRSKF